MSHVLQNPKHHQIRYPFDPQNPTQQKSVNYKNDTAVKPQAKQLAARSMTLLDPKKPVLSTSELKHI